MTLQIVTLPTVVDVDADAETTPEKSTSSASEQNHTTPENITSSAPVRRRLVGKRPRPAEFIEPRSLDEALEEAEENHENIGAVWKHFRRHACHRVMYWRVRYRLKAWAAIQMRLPPEERDEACTDAFYNCLRQRWKRGD